MIMKSAAQRCRSSPPRDRANWRLRAKGFLSPENAPVYDAHVTSQQTKHVERIRRSADALQRLRLGDGRCHFHFLHRLPCPLCLRRDMWRLHHHIHQRLLSIDIALHRLAS